MSEAAPGTGPSGYRASTRAFREYLQATSAASGSGSWRRIACRSCIGGGLCGRRSAVWEAFFREYCPFLWLVAGRPASRAADQLRPRVLCDRGADGRRQDGSAMRAGSFRGGWLWAVTAHLLEARCCRQMRETADNRPTALRLKPCRTTSASRHFSPSFLNELADGLAGALRALPRVKAAFLNMYYFQGLTLAEAAAELTVHESTASRWNAAILGELQRRMDRFLRRDRGWTTADVTDFMERCLGYLVGRLEKLRRSLQTD